MLFINIIVISIVCKLITDSSIQGNTVLISQLRSTTFNATLHVRISRMWEFRGGNEQDDLKHLDLVLIDEKVVDLISNFPFHLVTLI
jgi:replication factor A1